MKNTPASKVFVLSFMFLLVMGTLLVTSLFERITVQEREKAVAFLEDAQKYANFLGYSNKAEPLLQTLRRKILLSERGKDLLLAYRDAYVFLLYITVLRTLQAGLLLFVVIVLLAIFRWLKAIRPELAWKFHAWKIRRTKGLTGHAIDKAISYLIALMEKSEVPASIGHHAPISGGLRNHTWRVVQNALRIYREEYRELYPQFHHFHGLPPEKIVYLVALAHDAGKVRLYHRKNGTYQTFRIPELSQSKILFGEVLKRAGVPKAQKNALVQCLDPHAKYLPKELQALREIIQRADRSAVSVELGGEATVPMPKTKPIEEIPKGEEAEGKGEQGSVIVQDLLEDSRTHRLILEAYFEVLKELNVNGVKGPDYDAWYDPEKDLLALNVWKVAQRVTVYLQRYTDHPLSRLMPRAGSRKLHPIVPLMTKVLEKAGILRTDYNDIYAERGLFNIRAGSVRFNAVYLIKTDTVPPDLLQRWRDPSQTLNIYPIKVLARRVFAE